ncbi:MAG TPA: hypothetical protein VGR06_41555 [Actinophytocola sp.]|uniref:hypothetical protein n=1 Tax=Actinophytocola sp. TaxID=1872138 RepID=UPI002DFE06D2|nr:hypothetical protein [Actinophytocola sp.]
MMEPIRTWTFDGDNPMTISLYKPVVTVKCGNGPEAELSPNQLKQLTERLEDVGEFFESEDPEVL